MPDILDITHAEASAAILRHVAERRLIQHGWHDRSRDGRKVACLLGAIHPKVKEAADCNGDLMPMWFAELTPTLFDGIPADEIYPIPRRYGELVARWHVLTDAQWDAILTRVLIRCIDDAVAAARPVNEGKSYWTQVVGACDQVKTALETGDKDALSAAGSAAWSAARSAGSAAMSAARAAESAAGSAAWSAAWSAARSAGSAAMSAAESAAWSAAMSAARAAESAARSAAYLSLFNFVLDQIEAECVAAGG